MKYDFNFSQMPDYVLIKTGGFDVVEDLYKLLKDLFASPKWQQGTPVIFDHQYLDLKKMTFKQVTMIQEIVEFHAQKLAGAKCAFVISSNNKTLATELSNQSEQKSISQIKLFTDLEAAKKWVLDASNGSGS